MEVEDVEVKYPTENDEVKAYLVKPKGKGVFLALY